MSATDKPSLRPPDDIAALARLQHIWRNHPGLMGQLAAVNHGTLAMRFIVTGFAFLLAGGILSMFIRLQLAWFGAEVLSAERYNQFVTMHGTTMMFLFAVPILEGMAIYLLPKMLGARDLPFPRLGAFGYWCYLFGGLFLYSSFLFGEVPDGGWFMYVPLSSATWSPGMGADFWLIGVTFSEIAAVTAAVELIVSVLKTRAPGMRIHTMPLFAWYILVTAFMIALGFPPLILGSILLEIERAFGFAFFDIARGGDPLLWQHLFWLFGHPEVYIIFLPAAGIVTTLIASFSRVPVAGYLWIVLAIVTTGFLSFGLWVHHMFAVGIPQLALAFFSAASMAVAIPMAIQFFAWIATLWMGQPWVRVPMLYLIGFFVIFILGGLTGVMLALVPFDWQVHDTHFVVAHLHYVLIGGMLFPLIAGLYYWLPLASARLPDETLGRAGFWLVFTGFNLTFLPMHLTGMLGLPRRVYTYSAELGVEWLNLLSTAASFLLMVGMAAVAIDVVLCLRHGRRSPRNPWQAGTLEWALPTPVPPYNFASAPVVDDRYPLWRDPGLADKVNGTGGLLARPASAHRELLCTGMHSGQPEHVMRVSGSTLQPLVLAGIVAAVLACFIAKRYVAAGLLMLPLVAAVCVWLWTTGDRHAPDRIDAGNGLMLPSQYASVNAAGWWAVLMSLLIVGSLFASLVFSYFYLWLGSTAWPPAGFVPVPGLAWTALSLAACVILQWAARRELAKDNRRRACTLLAGVALASSVHLVLLAGVVKVATGVPQAHAYASVTWLLAGFHGLHMIVLAIAAVWLLLRVHRGYVRPRRDLEARIVFALGRYAFVQGTIVLAIIHLFPDLA
jgi:cytochrome c oxidase subunit I+III